METDKKYIEEIHGLLNDLDFPGQHQPLDVRLRSLVGAWARLQQDYEKLRTASLVSASDWQKIVSALEAYKIYSYQPDEIESLLVRIRVAQSKRESRTTEEAG